MANKRTSPYAAVIAALCLSAGAARATAATATWDGGGTNTCTGGTAFNDGTIVVNGSLATGQITIDGSSTVNGSGEINFTSGDMIVVTGTLTATSMKFDLTAMHGSEYTIVDYSAGTTGLPSPLNNLLTAGSVAQAWELADTGTTIVASRPPPGTVIHRR